MLKREGFIVTIPIKNERGEVVGHVDAISLKGLLAIAHGEGLSAITTEVVQLPTDSNAKVAVVRATAETRKGRFSGIGDANPSNVNRRIAPHILRMAESRAVARALRLAVNIGEVALEELGDDFAIDAGARVSTGHADPQLNAPGTAGAPRPSQNNGGNGAGAANGRSPDVGDRVTARQVSAINSACRRLGVSQTDLSGLLADRYGKQTVSCLTKAEASAVLTHFDSVGTPAHS